VRIIVRTMNESFEGLLKLFMLGFYSSISGRGERYKFSKVDLQS